MCVYVCVCVCVSVFEHPADSQKSNGHISLHSSLHFSPLESLHLPRRQAALLQHTWELVQQLSHLNTHTHTHTDACTLYANTHTHTHTHRCIHTIRKHTHTHTHALNLCSTGAAWLLLRFLFVCFFQPSCLFVSSLPGSLVSPS